MVQTHLLKLTRRIDPQLHSEAFIKPESALSWLHWHSADLLVCDSLFPDICAAELIRRIRQLPDGNDLSILMMAPWSDRDRRRQVLRIIAEQLGLSQADCEAIEVQVTPTNWAAPTSRYPPVSSVLLMPTTHSPPIVPINPRGQ